MKLPELPTPIKLKDVALRGFAMANTPKESTQVPVLVRTSITSDEPEFHVYMKGIGNALADKAKAEGVLLTWNYISTFVLVRHADETADLYLEDIFPQLEVMAKRDVQAGEIVYQSGVADVRRMRLGGLTLQPTDGVIVCFKVGWKFGLFFDLGSDGKFDADRMEKELGRLYRYLSFQELYEALGDKTLFDALVKAGWFPFVEVIGGEFERLLNAHKQSFNIEEEEQNLLKSFDDGRIDAMAERWWKRPALTGRQTILQPALDAFKRGDPVSTLKNVLTEIEGIIQDKHIAETGKGTSLKDLPKYVADKGVEKAGDDTSLLFPPQFLEYLSTNTYGNFDPKDPKGDVASRHSVGHGGADAEAYTMVRALQAILTLDQLSFYL